MILFCGIPSEAPLALAIEAARRKHVPMLVLNQREARFANLQIGVGAGGVTGWLDISGTRYALAEIRGVYTRLFDWRQLPENQSGAAQDAASGVSQKSRRFHEGLNTWLEAATCRVVNRASAMSSNMSKPYQSLLIARCGFPVPATLITNDVAEALDFQRLHGRVIYKSISSIRSIVREFDPASDRLANLRNLPTQFQAYVAGTNVRVHVAGERVFATEIQTDAVDYRYAGRDSMTVQMRPLRLPPRLRAKCLRLSEDLKLPVCGIDLKRTAQGEYYCFEVNPSPAYNYYQEHTGQPIASAIVDYLAKG